MQCRKVSNFTVNNIGIKKSCVETYKQETAALRRNTNVYIAVSLSSLTLQIVDETKANMCYYVLANIRRSKVLNRCFMEKCLNQLRSRLYYNADKRKQHGNYIDNQGRVTKRKALQQKLLREIRQTKQKVEEIIERENIWTIPNFLCIGRIITSPYLSYLIISHDYQIALWFLGFAGLTDLIDGWIARTWSSQASKLGSFLDPVADKLLVGTMFLSLTWVGLIPVPLTCLVIFRDIALISGASYIRYRSLPKPRTLARYFDPTYATVQLAPTMASKFNTAVQLSLVAGTLAAPVFHYIDHPVLQGLCYLTAITTLAGGLSYLVSKKTYKYLSKKKMTERPSS